MPARFKRRSAHPVEDGIRADVLAALSEIERQHAVTVFYACESGSRAWGFAAPETFARLQTLASDYFSSIRGITITCTWRKRIVAAICTQKACA
ncbi:MAG: nucleotidyltransferase domain-containing protein [Zoogloeaceae bacterium]|jgi:hypothetical protein|nr:nucleotidyltransferase domain-containing protein [Zoogloeaceae bacterium]